MLYPVEPHYLYEWGEPFSGWARNWVRRNHWRVSHAIGSEEDAMARCAMLFALTVKRYGMKAAGPAHIMALFKTTIRMDWNDLSESATAIRENTITDELPDGLLESRVAPEESAESVLHSVLADASEECRAVILMVLDAPAEFLDSLELMPAQLNRRLKRYCGISSESDLIGELRSLLYARGTR